MGTHRLKLPPLLLLLLWAQTAHSQPLPYGLHYRYLTPLVNPALAGTRPCISLTGIFIVEGAHLQDLWARSSGAFLTLGGSAAVGTRTQHSAFGFSGLYERQAGGLLTLLAGSVHFSQRILHSHNNLNLLLGVGGGINLYTLNKSLIVTVPTLPLQPPPNSITALTGEKLLPQVQAGIALTHPNLLVSLSVSNLTRAPLHFSPASAPALPLEWNLMAMGRLTAASYGVRWRPYAYTSYYGKQWMATPGILVELPVLSANLSLHLASRFAGISIGIGVRLDRVWSFYEASPLAYPLRLNNHLTFTTTICPTSHKTAHPIECPFPR